MIQRGLCVAAAVMAIGHVSPAQAETYTTYECVFSVPGIGGDEIKGFIGIGADGKAFTVDFKPNSDTPYRVPAAIRKTGGKDRLFAFTLDNPGQADVGIQKLDFMLRIPPEGGKSRISVTARRFHGNPSGNGTCTRRDNVSLPF